MNEMASARKTGEERSFVGADGNRLAATVFRGGCPPVLFFHGGGQTRYAWDSSARAVQQAGWTSITVDMRGHGESEWLIDKQYAFEDFGRDIACIAAEMEREIGSKPVAIGASLGGIASLIAQYESAQTAFAALVLVDVTPKMKRDGVEKIIGFMSDRMEQGFATLEEAADVITAYLPNRSRPKSLDGLSKNLRLGKDGRYRWHWDPALLNGPRPINSGSSEAFRMDAARALTIPTLLVHGSKSELVSQEQAQAFQDLVPHARLADVSGAGHMVAGDRNDAFQAAILRFLKEDVGLVGASDQ